MLVDVLVPMSLFALALVVVSLFALLAGRRLTAAVLSLISVMLCYVLSAGWMQPEVVVGVSSAGEPVIAQLSGERVYSSLFMGLTFFSFALFGMAAASMVFEVFSERDEEGF